MNGKNADEMFIKGVDRLGFKLVGAMARIFGSLAARDEEAYWYAIATATGQGFVDLAAAVGATVTGTIQISQEADFVATRVLSQSVDPVAGTIIASPSWTASFTDGGTDRTLQSAQIHVDTLAGTSQRSTPFTKNRLFRRNSTITFNFTNLIATATRIYVVMQGYKIYDEASLDLVRRR